MVHFKNLRRWLRIRATGSAVGFFSVHLPRVGRYSFLRYSR
jgi:hypothetical protein